MIVCCDDFFNRIKTEETDNTEGNTIWLLRGEILPGSSSAHICTVMILGLMCAFLICYAASNTLRIAKEELTPPCSFYTRPKGISGTWTRQNWSFEFRAQIAKILNVQICIVIT